MHKRVLFVIGSLKVGGAETQMAVLAEGLASRNWTVEVFALDVGGPLAERLAAGGIRVFGGRRKANGSSGLARLVRLARNGVYLALHCAKTRPRVVHAYLPLANFVGAVAARAAMVPVVVTSKRGMGTHQERHPPFKWTDRIANSLSTQVTANSLAVATDAHRRDGYPKSKIAIIPNGLELTNFESVHQLRSQMRRELGLSNENIAIVKIANLIPYKGHADLIEAFADVCATAPQTRLFLVGQDRGIQDDLVARLKYRGIDHSVQLLGERNDVPALLSAMDLGVVASHEEGLSNALIEKLAAGLPAVATDVGGNSEILEAMPNCRLAKPRDSKDLARALLEVIASLPERQREPEVRKGLVRKRYSVHAMVDLYERLYLEGRSR